MTETLPLLPEERERFPNRKQQALTARVLTAILALVFGVSSFRKDAILYSLAFGVFCFVVLYPFARLSQFVSTLSLSRDLREGKKLVVRATVRHHSNRRVSVTTSSGKSLMLSISGYTEFDYDWDDDEFGSVHFERDRMYRMEYLPRSKVLLRASE